MVGAFGWRARKAASSGRDLVRRRALGAPPRQDPVDRRRHRSLLSYASTSNDRTSRSPSLARPCEEPQLQQHVDADDLGAQALEERAGGRRGAAGGEHVVDHQHPVARLGPRRGGPAPRRRRTRARRAAPRPPTAACRACGSAAATRRAGRPPAPPAGTPAPRCPATWLTLGARPRRRRWRRR